MTSAADERELREDQLDPDPHRQFSAWFQDAIDSGEPMPAAVALATVDDDGRPSVRMMLLEHVDARGFVLQTNLESPKARHLARVPHAALTFFWPRLVRQVRVTGPVVQISRDEVAGYFSALPAGVKAMLNACNQSTVIPDRQSLDDLFARAMAMGACDLPEHWGCFRVQTETIEFWQARENWLQDRLRYTRDGTAWRIERLVP